MFHPSDPGNPFLIAREREEYERTIASKVDDFGSIVITDGEYNILKQADKTPVLITDRNKTDAERLFFLDFATKQGNYCCIRERGRSYLRYFDDKKSSEKIARIHNWKIAAFSVFGSALLARPLWAGIDWLVAIVIQLIDKLK